MGKKLTFFESLFLNKRDKEILLSSDDTFNDIDDFSDENINASTESSIKVILEKTTSMSSLDANDFSGNDTTDSPMLEEKELILFDTIENALDYVIDDVEDDTPDSNLDNYAMTNLDDDIIVEEHFKISVKDQADDSNSDDDSDFELDIIHYDDLDDDINLGDTIIFNAGELNSRIENKLAALENADLVEDLELAEDLELVQDLDLAEDLELVQDLDLAEDLELIQDLELVEDLKDLDTLDADDMDIEFVSLDFGDDSFASLDDSNSDPVFATIEGGVIHFDLDDQLEDEYSEDGSDYDSSVDDVEILAELKVDIITEDKIEDDDSESNFPTLDLLSNETLDDLSNNENTDDSDNDEINIPMI